MAGFRRKVSGQTKAEVKDKLKALHSELDAGIRTIAAYTVEKAVADWLDEGLPGRSAKTIEVNRDSLRPLLAIIGGHPYHVLDSTGSPYSAGPTSGRRCITAAVCAVTGPWLPARRRVR